MYGKILVAIDGSEMSIKALDFGVSLAQKFDSEIEVISVLEEFKLPFAAEYSLWSAESRAIRIKEIMSGLDAAIKNVSEKYGELDIQVRLEEGRPAQVIVETAKNENFELIIVGSRGMNRLEGWVLGSVSREIVEDSQIPVLVIK